MVSECNKSNRMEKKIRSEELFYGCAAKGKKKGSINSNFVVGILCSKGLLLFEQYFGSITGTRFASI